MLCACVAHIWQHGTDALHIAANQGRLEVVELLLTQQHRLDIDHQMQVPFVTYLLHPLTAETCCTLPTGVFISWYIVL